MKVQVYVKSAIDLQTKQGAYAFCFIAMGQKVESKKRFQKIINTLTLGDCAAYINALYYLGCETIAPEITEIEVITDSGKVEAILTTYKADKNCVDVANYWREKGKPKFTALQSFTVKKVSAKVVGKEPYNYLLQHCMAMAQGELNILRSITN